MFKLTVFVLILFIAFGDSQVIKTTLRPVRPIMIGVPPVSCAKICVSPVGAVGLGGECECKDAAGNIQAVSDMDVRKSRILCGATCVRTSQRYSNYPKFGEACKCLASEPNFPL
ncbi:unnamed protein product [Bursaphelenchus xylophilus]|uniref:(pine wood nematode) hypothetical protein n=1 Tax=Bursaphelenchus xylophilus TaxID=6326 RepID=A0A1I7RUH0_BURXY|nr:unnamed protein product [Bursaphelenchus xylophilus]CAG9114121.1 unnamed protein product [Bursaphelenchus xylophilus]